jgi:hypothetical protein
VGERPAFDADFVAVDDKDVGEGVDRQGRDQLG